MAASSCTITVRIPASFDRADPAARTRMQHNLQMIQSAASWAKTEEDVRSYPMGGSTRDIVIRADQIFEFVSVTFRDLGHEGRVLKISSRTVRVMSDVWEDESFPIVWTGEEIKELNWTGFTHQTYRTKEEMDAGGSWHVSHYLPGFEPPAAENLNSTYIAERSPAYDTYTFHVVRWVADATDEVKAAAEAWTVEQHRVARIRGRAQSFAAAVTGAIRAEREVRKDVDAVVVKGRKVKKGEVVRITWVADGQYGPYANVIVNSTGAQVKFVSTDNLRVVPDMTARFKKFAEQYGMPNDLSLILAQYAMGNMEWSMVCDMIADQGEGEHSGHEISEFLRAMPPATE